MRESVPSRPRSRRIDRAGVSRGCDEPAEESSLRRFVVFDLVSIVRPIVRDSYKEQHWFLTEQREEVSSMSALLAVVERAAETNLLLAEDYLARNPVGDQGVPEAGAPPAAGGAL